MHARLVGVALLVSLTAGTAATTLYLSGVEEAVDRIVPNDNRAPAGARAAT
jgi:hypothetical protein